MTEIIRNPKDPVKILKQREKHWAEIEELDGSIITLPTGYMGMRRKNIPEGFCVDGQLDKELKDRIMANVIPLRPIEVPTFRQNADKMIKLAQDSLGTDNVMLLALPINSYQGKDWEIGFVATQDFFSAEPSLLLEEWDIAKEEGDTPLANSKKLAYLALREESSNV
jgi:hypothetical protein